MAADKVVMASFAASIALITYRDFKQADSSWPLGKVPPPYRYTWAGVAFGICELLTSFMDPRIGEVIAGGLFLGLAFNVVTKAPSTSGLAPVTAAKSPATGSTPSVPNPSPQNKAPGPTVVTPLNPGSGIA